MGSGLGPWVDCEVSEPRGLLFWKSVYAKLASHGIAWHGQSASLDNPLCDITVTVPRTSWRRKPSIRGAICIQLQARRFALHRCQHAVQWPYSRTDLYRPQAAWGGSLMFFDVLYPSNRVCDLSRTTSDSLAKKTFLAEDRLRYSLATPNTALTVKCTLLY